MSHRLYLIEISRYLKIGEKILGYSYIDFQNILWSVGGGTMTKPEKRGSSQIFIFYQYLVEKRF